MNFKKRRTGNPTAPVSTNVYNPALGGTLDRTQPSVRRGGDTPQNNRIEAGGIFGTVQDPSKDQKRKVGERLIQAQQEYHAMLQEQINLKKAAKHAERDLVAKDALDRELYNQKQGGPLSQTDKGKKREYFEALQNQQKDNSAPRQRDQDGRSYQAPAEDMGYGYRGPQADLSPQMQQYEEKQDFPNYQEDEDFQRRLEEYRREKMADVDGQSDLADPPNPYAYDDLQKYRSPDTDSPPLGANPYAGYDRGGKGYAAGPPQADSKASQRNYLVNNPIVTDAPNKRSTGGGFRAHQDITHEGMKVDRVQKPLGLNEGSSKDAYNSIKKKYGNHSAQYNILTGV